MFQLTSPTSVGSKPVFVFHKAVDVGGIVDWRRFVRNQFACSFVANAFSVLNCKQRCLFSASSSAALPQSEFFIDEQVISAADYLITILFSVPRLRPVQLYHAVEDLLHYLPVGMAHMVIYFPQNRGTTLGLPRFVIT